MFEHFVGAMQPVLARARRMLLGRETLNTCALEDTSREVERNPLASEAYWESVAQTDTPQPAGVTCRDLEEALEALNGEFGPRVRSDRQKSKYALSAPGIPRTVLSSSVKALEQDHTIAPLSSFDPRLVNLANSLSRPGERLPLVVGTYQSRAFRRSIAYWVGGSEEVLVSSMCDLRKHLETWAGDYPDPGRWLEVEEAARVEARRQVEEMERRAEECERRALLGQTEAARYRLLLELGRYLVCLGQGTTDLNRVMYDQMNRGIASAQRLKQCMDKLGGDYPQWDPELCRELERFVQPLTEGQRRARLLGKELDAALEDPRWSALLST